MKNAENMMELAKAVADDFKATMKEFDFETFKEMAKCYCWTSVDIKEEVDAIIRQYNAYIDELDGSEVFLNDDSVNYREFSKMWHKYLND